MQFLNVKTVLLTITVLLARREPVVAVDAEQHISNRNSSASLFSTPIWINDDVLAPNEIKKLKRLVNLERKNSPNGLSKSNIGGWQSSPGWYHQLIEHRIGIMQLFRDIILRNTIEFLLQYEQTLPVDIQSKNIKHMEVWIDGGWANENKFQDFNMPHTHPESFIAGTFYLSKHLLTVNMRQLAGIYLSQFRYDLY